MSDRKNYFPTQNDASFRAREQGAGEILLVPSSPISLADLAGGVPNRSGVTVNRVLYDQLGKSMLFPFSVYGASGPEYVVVGPRLGGEETNSVLYFAAPNKGYGLDTDDILNDWHGLYEDNYHAKRLNAHARMPGWSQWEASKQLVLGVIERNYAGAYSYKFAQSDPDDVVIPVIRWKTFPDRQRQIALEGLDDRIRYSLAAALPSHVPDPSRLDNGMGITFLSAYSPDQTQWERRDSYTGKAGAETQSIGSTQVLPYAIRKISEVRFGRIADDPTINPEHSPLLALFESHINQGSR